MLEDALRLVFGEEWEEKRRGCVYADHFMGEPVIFFDLDRQMAQVVFAEGMGLYYCPDMFYANGFEGPMKDNAAMHAAVQRQMHEIYLDALKRQELSTMVRKLSEWINFVDTVEEDLGSYAQGENIMKSLVRGTTWLSWVRTTRMAKTLPGLIHQAKEETKKSVLLYDMMGGFVDYGRNLFGGQIERLDGQLGAEGKAELVRCHEMTGEIISVYSQLSRNAERLNREIERLERLVM